MDARERIGRIISALEETYRAEPSGAVLDALNGWRRALDELDVVPEDQMAGAVRTGTAVPGADPKSSAMIESS